MLKIDNISKTFFPGTVNERKALQGLSLELDESDFVTVIGSEPLFDASGCCSSSRVSQFPHSDPCLMRTWMRILDFAPEKVKPTRLGLFVGTSRTSEMSAMFTPSSVF